MKTAFALVLSLCAPPLLAGHPQAAGGDTPASTAAADVLDRFLHSGGPPLNSYRARRTLAASTMGGQMKAEVDAWTYLDRDGTFRFDVIRQSGSGLIREHVLLKALETEQRTVNQRETGHAE